MTKISLETNSDKIKKMMDFSSKAKELRMQEMVDLGKRRYPNAHDTQYNYVYNC